MKSEKEIRWVGTSYDDLLSFPGDARRDAGFQLSKVQAGFDPTDWKPFPDIGPGVREIRIRDCDGAYRVLYVTSFDEAIYVLHSFQKKTQATSRQDKDIAKVRYRSIAHQRKYLT
jgi:phage-related protein